MSDVTLPSVDGLGTGKGRMTVILSFHYKLMITILIHHCLEGQLYSFHRWPSSGEQGEGVPPAGSLQQCTMCGWLSKV